MMGTYFGNTAAGRRVLPKKDPVVGGVAPPRQIPVALDSCSPVGIVHVAM